jgi:lysophospholipase L1-like esterase
MNEIYLFGDSASQGLVLDDNGQYHVSRKGCIRLLKRKGFPIRNYAVHGYTVLQGLESFEQMQIEPGARCVIQFGGNDCDFNWKEVAERPDEGHLPMSTISDFVETYTNIINVIKSLGKTPVLLSLPPIDSSRYFAHISRGISGENIMRWMRYDKQYITNWHERYNIEIFKLAVANDVPIIDITSIFLERKNYSDYLCEDGIHPNGEGHKLIAAAIKDHVTRRSISFD